MVPRRNQARPSVREAVVKVWLVTSWYGRKVPFTLPPEVGSIQVVNSQTFWVNGELSQPPKGLWVWAMSPAIARRYTSAIHNAEHLLAAQGGHPARLGRRRGIPLLANKPWCDYLRRKLIRLSSQEASSQTDPTRRSKKTGSSREEGEPAACSPPR